MWDASFARSACSRHKGSVHDYLPPLRGISRTDMISRLFLWTILIQMLGPLPASEASFMMLYLPYVTLSTATEGSRPPLSATPKFHSILPSRRNSRHTLICDIAP